MHKNYRPTVNEVRHPRREEAKTRDDPDSGTGSETEAYNPHPKERLAGPEVNVTFPPPLFLSYRNFYWNSGMRNLETGNSGDRRPMILEASPKSSPPLSIESEGTPRNELLNGQRSLGGSRPIQNEVPRFLGETFVGDKKFTKNSVNACDGNLPRFISEPSHFEFNNRDVWRMPHRLIASVKRFPLSLYGEVEDGSFLFPAHFNGDESLDFLKRELLPKIFIANPPFSVWALMAERSYHFCRENNTWCVLVAPDNQKHHWYSSWIESPVIHVTHIYLNTPLKFQRGMQAEGARHSPVNTILVFINVVGTPIGVDNTDDGNFSLKWAQIKEWNFPIMKSGAARLIHNLKKRVLTIESEFANFQGDRIPEYLKNYVPPKAKLFPRHTNEWDDYGNARWEFEIHPVLREKCPQSVIDTKTYRRMIFKKGKEPFRNPNKQIWSEKDEHIFCDHCGKSGHVREFCLNRCLSKHDKIRFPTKQDEILFVYITDKMKQYQPSEKPANVGLQFHIRNQESRCARHERAEYFKNEVVKFALDTYGTKFDWNPINTGSYSEVRNAIPMWYAIGTNRQTLQRMVVGYRIPVVKPDFVDVEPDFTDMTMEDCREIHDKYTLPGLKKKQIVRVPKSFIRTLSNHFPLDQGKKIRIITDATSINNLCSKYALKLPSVSDTCRDLPLGFCGSIDITEMFHHLVVRGCDIPLTGFASVDVETMKVSYYVCLVYGFGWGHVPKVCMSFMSNIERYLATMMWVRLYYDDLPFCTCELDWTIDEYHYFVCWILDLFFDLRLPTTKQQLSPRTFMEFIGKIFDSVKGKATCKPESALKLLALGYNLLENHKCSILELISFLAKINYALNYESCRICRKLYAEAYNHAINLSLKRKTSVKNALKAKIPVPKTRIKAILVKFIDRLESAGVHIGLPHPRDCVQIWSDASNLTCGYWASIPNEGCTRYNTFRLPKNMRSMNSREMTAQNCSTMAELYAIWLSLTRDNYLTKSIHEIGAVVIYTDSLSACWRLWNETFRCDNFDNLISMILAVMETFPYATIKWRPRETHGATIADYHSKPHVWGNFNKHNTFCLRMKSFKTAFARNFLCHRHENLEWRWNFPWSLFTKLMPKNDDVRALWQSRRATTVVVVPFSLGNRTAYQNIFENIINHKMNLIIVIPVFKYTLDFIRGASCTFSCSTPSRFVTVTSSSSHLPRVRHTCVRVEGGLLW